jgi:uncharacterized protein
MRDLVEFIAKSVVDKPEAVEVTQMRGSQAIVLKLRVAAEDKGWVIGRHGRVANAMRTMLRVAAAVKSPGRRVLLEIV